MTHIGDDPDHFGWGRSASRSTDRHDPAFLDVFDTFGNEECSTPAIGQSLAPNCGSKMDSRDHRAGQSEQVEAEEEMSEPASRLLATVRRELVFPPTTPYRRGARRLDTGNSDDVHWTVCSLSVIAKPSRLMPLPTEAN
jgi:hypothetical protein